MLLTLGLIEYQHLGEKIKISNEKTNNVINS